MYTITSWRRDREKKPDFRCDLPPFPATRFFDQMWAIGDESVACFLLLTREGLVLIDCMFPGEHYLAVLEQGLADAGFTYADIKAVLITHGHFDHYGNARLIREKSGCRLYMSRIDYEICRRDQDKRDHPMARDPRYQPLDYALDGLLEDGDVFTLGDTHIRCILTPGHTPGCMSFLIPVSDEGRPHMAALWGGTGITPESDKEAYLASLDKFHDRCREARVDAAFSNHPCVDNGTDKLQLIRNIVPGVPNPFVFGWEAYCRYEDKFRKMCLGAMDADR